MSILDTRLWIFVKPTFLKSKRNGKTVHRPTLKNISLDFKRSQSSEAGTFAENFQNREAARAEFQDALHTTVDSWAVCNDVEKVLSTTNVKIYVVSFMSLLQLLWFVKVISTDPNLA